MNMKVACVITNEKCPKLINNYNKFIIIYYKKFQLDYLICFELVL